MDTREKIIETATRLFSTHGYESTSLSQVARDARVSKALIFWHFESKENLFQAVLSRTIEPYSWDLGRDLDGLSEPDQLKKLMDLYYEFVTENMHSVRFFMSLFLREEKRPGELFERILALYGLYKTLLSEVITRGRESGSLKSSLEADLHSSLVLSALNGILLQAFVQHPRSPAAPALLEELKRTFVDQFTV